MNENIKKENIDLFVESLYKLQNKIETIVVTLRLERDTHVPDLMTRIRILPSVAVVGQKDKVDRYAEGDARLQISIKYLPKSTEIYKSIKHISMMIKRLPGVLNVTVEEYKKRKVTSRGNKIIF